MTNKLVVLSVALVALTLGMVGAQMGQGFLYRGQDMNVLRSIRMNDRSTFPAAGHDFYRSHPRTRTPYNPTMSMDEMIARQKQEAANMQDPVAKAMTLTRNLESRICEANEDLSIVDDAPCRTNDECDLICRDYAAKQEEVVTAFYCDPRGNTCGCCTPQSQSGGRSESFGEPSFGGSGDMGTSSFGMGDSGFGSSDMGASSFGMGDSGFGNSGFGPSTGGFGSSSQPFDSSFANEGSNMGSNLMAQPPMNTNMPSNMMPPAGYAPDPNAGAAAGAMPYDPNAYNQPNYYPSDMSGFAAM